MGLQAAVVVLNTAPDSAGPQVYQINPAGNIMDPSGRGTLSNHGCRLLCCMGAKHEVVRDALERALTKTTQQHLSQDEMEDLVRNAIAEGVGSLKGRTVYMQCLSPDGTLHAERTLNQ